MAIDGFNEILNIVYIAKKLHDMGKYELVAESFYDSIEYDVYYKNMYSLISNIFEHHSCRYNEERGYEIHVLSDPVIVDFYVLAGKYGKRNDIPEKENPYLIEAEQEVYDNLYGPCCLSWKLIGHTEPKKPFHSKLALFISYECRCTDIGWLAYKLVEIYEWFVDKCDDLKAIEEKYKPIPGQMVLTGYKRMYKGAIVA
jgi:hypothetical protein